MPTIAKSSQTTDYPVPDEGVYVFELKAVREPTTAPNTFPGREGTMRTSVPLLWVVRDDEDFGGMEVLNFYTLTMGNTQMPSKLRPFVKAMLGREIDDENDAIDLEGLVGRRIQATVSHYTKNNGTIGAKLESPIALRKRRSKPAPEPVAESDDDPFEDGVDEETV